jgi:membrane protein CcdC involved in cytochrome C biogenesis
MGVTDIARRGITRMLRATAMDLAHPPPALYLAATIAGAVVLLVWRFRETSTPVSIRSLVIPPLGMSTGLGMFVVPQTRVPLSWAILALAVGAIAFAWPLMRSSKLTRLGDRVFMKRSRAFLWILLALIGVRFALRAWIEQHVSPLQTGSLFFLIAFGAIVRWRVSLVLEFRRLTEQPVEGAVVNR